ncbi:MAG: helix-turn-helix domain-containing protein, partial [Hansschlegelia sp.]
KKYALANGMPVRPLSAEARMELARGRFPGNVRELENTIHRAVLLSTGPEIGPEAIRNPDGAPLGSGPRDAASRAAETAESVTRNFIGRTIADVERDLIFDTLGHTRGNRTHAANILGISIRTLRNKLNQYDDEGFAVPPPPSGVAAA